MASVRSMTLIFLISSVLTSAAVWAQSEGESKKPKAEEGVAAYIGGKPVSLAELDGKVLKTDMKLAQSLYDARQKALDGMIMERLLAEEAAAMNISVDELVTKRLAEKAQPVTDADVEAFFNARRSQMRGQTLESMGGRIREYLKAQREADARRDLLEELKKKFDVRIALEPPRADVVIAASDPAQGPAEAAVTIVEYSDFQ